MLDLAWSIWSRRKWLAIVLFVLPFTAAASAIVFMPKIYRSTATVIIERQQLPEALVRSTVTSELETRLRTISQEALSRSRLDTLMSRFGLYAELRKSQPTEVVIDRMRRDIHLELRGADTRSRGTTIAFALSYQGRDPETVAHVTNALASFYIEENLKARERQATGTAQFLKVQLEETRKRLDDQEQRVSEFKKRYLGELPQQMSANLATIEQLNAQLRLNSVSRIRLEEKRELLAMQVPGESPLATPLEGAAAAAAAPAAAPPPPDPSAARLAQLRHQLDELAARYHESHPAMIQKKAEVLALEERIARSPKPADAPPPGPEPRQAPPAQRVPNLQAERLRQALAETEAEIKVLRDEDRRLRDALALHEQRVANTPRREQEFQELSRDYESTKGLYQSLTQRHDEAQLAESMEQRQKGEQFRILDPALPSAVPAAPKRARLLVAALVLSLGLAGGAVVLAEQLDTSFHLLDDLREFTTVPVVASIPSMVTASDKRRRRWRLGLAATGTALTLVLLVGASYFLVRGNEALVLW